jgi:hypothetical protein
MGINNLYNIFNKKIILNNFELIFHFEEYKLWLIGIIKKIIIF